jgi:hypothetical protein
VSIGKQPLSSYKSTICNNLEYQKLEQQILRQKRDLAKAKNTAENLSTALAGLNVETKKTTEKVSILAGQLEKISLSLVMAREKGITIAPKNEYIIYHLIILKTRDNTT